MSELMAGRRPLRLLAEGLEDVAEEFGRLAEALQAYSPRLAAMTLEVVGKARVSARQVRDGAYGPVEGGLYDTLLALPPRERRVWALHRLVNKTLAEVAEAFGLEESVVAEIVAHVDERLGIA